MASLDDLQRRLGGTIRIGSDCWLDTRIGTLRASVIVRHLPLTGRRILDVAVFTPGAPALRPFQRVGRWSSMMRPESIPAMSHGFVFVGCREGVLYARSFESLDVEDVLGALRELESWAYRPWYHVVIAEPAPRRFSVDITSAVVAALVVLVVLLWRWLR